MTITFLAANFHGAPFSRKYQITNDKSRINDYIVLSTTGGETMQIYLLKDLPGKGKAGEIINVNDGYGKNYLIKNKIGTAVDNAIMTQVKAKAQSDAHKKSEDIKATRESASAVNGVTVTISAQMGANGKMFGSVTSAEIATALGKMDIEIDKKTIQLSEPIKTLGSYKIKAKFQHGIEAEFNLSVVQK
jgi:large subunit ribosomal protein L9